VELGFQLNEGDGGAAVVGIGKERKIGRSALISSLALHHLAGAFDVIGTESEDLGGLAETII